MKMSFMKVIFLIFSISASIYSQTSEYFNKITYPSGFSIDKRNKGIAFWGPEEYTKSIDLYPNKDFSENPKKLRETNISFVEKHDEWYFIAKNKTPIGWINKKDFSGIDYYYNAKKRYQDNPCKYLYYLIKEKDALKNNQYLTRAGIILEYNNNVNKRVFENGIDYFGQSYVYVENIWKKFPLIFIQYYEGAEFTLINPDNQKNDIFFPAEPVFSPNQKEFISVGAIYSENIEVKFVSQKGNQFYSQKFVTKYDSNYEISKIVWENDNFVRIHFINNLGEKETILTFKKNEIWSTQNPDYVT